MASGCACEAGNKEFVGEFVLKQVVLGARRLIQITVGRAGLGPTIYDIKLRTFKGTNTHP